MARLILLLILFLLSLLVVFRAPTNFLWYVSILVTEFSWVFILPIVLLLWWPFHHALYKAVGVTLGTVAVLLLLFPYWQAWRLSRKLKATFCTTFPCNPALVNAPFHPLQIFASLHTRKVSFKKFVYDTTHELSLDFYAAEKKGKRPCVIVIHGGAWASGDSQQLPELNSEIAKWGYHAASISYRLAPKAVYPLQLEDVNNAIAYLKKNAEALSLDSSRFVLLGRSAGGQIALSAAYTLHEVSIKGVVDFYGPTDMVWGYENPTSPLVLDSRKIMEDYLGGTLQQVPDQYRRSSATETVTTQTPPTLMIYGENDPLVSPRHGSRLSPKLQAQGVPFFALYLPWATHGFDFTLNGPGGQISTWAVRNFLEAILEKEK